MYCIYMRIAKFYNNKSCNQYFQNIDNKIIYY